MSIKANPLRIMILSNTLSAGGAERFAAGLLTGLSPARIRPHLVLLRGEITYHLPDDTPVRLLDYHKPYELPKAIWRLRRCIRQIRPNLILGAGTSVNVVIGLALAALKHRPAWIAPVDTNLERSDLWLRRMILNPLHRQADCIVAISCSMHRHMSTVLPHLAPKIVQLYNPVDFQHIRALSRKAPSWIRPQKVPLIVTAGRAHPVKRWDILLEAFAKVVQTRVAILALCGDGPQLSALKEQARQLNIADYVHFLGHCENPFAIMVQADLFVLSSQAEGMPYALIEAQGLGLCAVATRCAYGPEEIVVHGQTGLLTAVNDSDALAKAISTLLADDNQRNRMGVKAKEKVQKQFDYRRRCREWQALIQQVAAKR